MRNISTQEIVRDIRAGMDDASLMAKYEISAKGLRDLFRQLLERGAISQGDLIERIATRGPSQNPPQPPSRPAQPQVIANPARVPSTPTPPVPVSQRSENESKSFGDALFDWIYAGCRMIVHILAVLLCIYLFVQGGGHLGGAGLFVYIITWRLFYADNKDK